MTYDPRSYWERLHARDDLSAVGHVGLSPELNGVLYEAQRRNAVHFLRIHGVTAAHVYEAGAGRGDWFSAWRAVGAQRIVAGDLSSTAVARLSRLADEAHQIDISAPLGDPVARYDFVAAMYVLLHVVDEGRFRAATEYLAGLVKPGGHLLLAEPILLNALPQAKAPGAESVARRLEAYALPGMELLAIGAATVLAGNPIERSRLPRAAWAVMWRGLTAADRWRPTRRAVGWIIRRLDPVLCQAGFAPSSKLALFRRAA